MARAFNLYYELLFTISQYKDIWLNRLSVAYPQIRLVLNLIPPWCPSQRYELILYVKMVRFFLYILFPVLYKRIYKLLPIFLHNMTIIYLAPFLLLHSLHSIWQFSAVVGPF